MNFTSIGAWLDNRIDGAQRTWKGSVAQQTINNVMERSQQAAHTAVDKVSITASDAKENFQSNLKAVEAKNEGKGFLKKAFDVGMQGGLVGLMMKKPEAAPQPPAQTTPPPVQQHEGWNISA
jgi:hypothetical protein